MSPPLPPSTPCRLYEHYEGQDTKDNVLVMGVHNPNHDTTRPPITTFPTFPMFPTFHRGKRTRDRDAKGGIRERGREKICCCLSCIICLPLAPCPLCLSCPMWASSRPQNPGVKRTVNAPLLAPCAEARCVLRSHRIWDKMLR